MDNLPKEKIDTSSPSSKPVEGLGQPPEIEVMSQEEFDKPPPPPPKGKGKKRSLLSGKKIIFAVVIILIIVDIPIALRIYNNLKKPDEPTTQPQPTIAAQPSPQPTFTSPTAFPTAIQPTATLESDASESLIQTHAECFSGACIEIEGAGVDQCSLDADCLPGANFPAATESADLIEPETPTAAPTAVTTTPISTDEAVIIPDTPAAGTLSNTIIPLLSALALLLIAIIL